MIAAVLTGDLIDSTRATPERVGHTMHLLSGSLPDGMRWNWTADAVRFTRHRGDGWQALVEAPRALRWMLVLCAATRADGRALASRIAVGIGPVANTGSADLRDASGPAFAASGRCLDAMRKGERLALAGTDGAPGGMAVTAAERAVVGLLGERVAHWTAEQAEALAHFLHPDRPPAIAIAARLGITPQAVSYRLNGAGARVLRDTLEALEADWSERWGRAA